MNIKIIWVEEEKRKLLKKTLNEMKKNFKKIYYNYIFYEN